MSSEYFGGQKFAEIRMHICYDDLNSMFITIFKLIPYHFQHELCKKHIYLNRQILQLKSDYFGQHLC